jgi:hypothetical protein
MPPMTSESAIGESYFDLLEQSAKCDPSDWKSCMKNFRKVFNYEYRMKHGMLRKV